jgi:hypothetical protein
LTLSGAAVAAGGGQRFASLADLILQRPELEKAYAPSRNVRKSLIFAPRGPLSCFARDHLAETTGPLCWRSPRSCA